MPFFFSVWFVWFFVQTFSITLHLPLNKMLTHLLLFCWFPFWTTCILSLLHIRIMVSLLYCSICIWLDKMEIWVCYVFWPNLKSPPTSRPLFNCCLIIDVPVHYTHVDTYEYCNESDKYIVYYSIQITPTVYLDNDMMKMIEIS